ncbi:hypothetical protein PI124_g10422 [Phytophthora idaei]|nr:hypothetical protein PI124_g10422 [Phytophthora idaei]
MLIDVLHFWFSMRGTIGVLKKVKELMAKILPHHPVAKENFVDVALRILAIQDRAESNDRLRSRVNSKTINTLTLKPDQAYKNSSEDASLRAPTRAEILSVVRVGSRYVGILKRLVQKATKVFPTTSLQQPNTVKIASGPGMDFKKSVTPCLGLETIFSCQEREAFINTTTHVLYITEYLVLVEYTEAVLLMVYALYSMIAFHLPNCTYNQSLVNLSKHELITNRVLGISPVHQLGFVLETQATMVQSKLMLWFVYVLQVPLEHVGTDFSFSRNDFLATTQRNTIEGEIMPVNRNLPAGIPSRAIDRPIAVNKPSGLNVARFIAREEELHQARKYTYVNETNASRALWEEKQNRLSGSGARIQQNKRLDEERELLDKEVLAIRQARLQKYYEICYEEWEQELRARGLALVRDRD